MMAINSKIMEATADDGLAGLLVSVRALDCGGTSVTFCCIVLQLSDQLAAGNV